MMKRKLCQNHHFSYGNDPWLPRVLSIHTASVISPRDRHGK